MPFQCCDLSEYSQGIRHRSDCEFFLKQKKPVPPSGSDEDLFFWACKQTSVNAFGREVPVLVENYPLIWCAIQLKQLKTP